MGGVVSEGQEESGVYFGLFTDDVLTYLVIPISYISITNQYLYHLKQENY